MEGSYLWDIPVPADGRILWLAACPGLNALDSWDGDIHGLQGTRLLILGEAAHGVHPKSGNCKAN